MTNMISTKEDFKNKYIDLSNKELNGEVTEEVFNKLKKCFEKLRYNTFISWHTACNGMPVLFAYKNDTINMYASGNNSKYKEVSIYDIKGMPPRVITDINEIIMKPNTKYSLGTFTVKKYNIEDLKGGLIAVHLPEPVSFIIAMKYLNRSGEHFPLGYRAPDYTAWKKYREETCVMFDMGTGCIESFSRLHCDANSYTIITLKDLIGLEPTAKYITTHAELLKLHGRKVTCKIRGEFIKDARISANVYDFDNIYICQNKVDGTDAVQDKLGYAHSWFISGITNFYEVFGQIQCTEIQLVEEEELDSVEEEEDNQKWGMTHLLDEIKEDRGDRGDVVYGKDLGYAKENNVHITSTEPIPNYESFLIKEGSRAWALLALDRGEKIRLKNWGEEAFIQLVENYEGTCDILVDESGGQVSGSSFPKDGWEIYKETKEEPEMMTFKDLILTNNDTECKFKFVEYDMTLYTLTEKGIKFKYEGKWHYRTLEEVVIWLDKEIIKEQNANT